MNKNIISFSILLFIFAFISCEFDSDEEYYKNIEKPEEITVSLDLAGVKPDEPIYIYEDTKLYYSLNTAGKKLLSLQATINGENLSWVSDSYIVISKALLDKNKDNTLRLNIQIKTNSGSLADIMDAEYYEGDFSFLLKPVDNDFDLAVQNAQTNEGYLRLEWDKPSFEQLEIDGYIISFTDTRGRQQNVTLDGATTSYTDKDYVYGYRPYTITMKFAGDKISEKTYVYNMSYTTINGDDVFFEFKDLEETKISWKSNKYRCKYYILHDRNDRVVASATFDAPEVYLPAPVFPEERGFYTIVIVPDDMEASEVSYSSGGIEKFYQYQAPASILDMSPIAYDIANKLIYGRTGATIQIGNAINLATIKSLDSPYFAYLSNVSFSPKSTKFLVFNGYDFGMSDNVIYLYDNKDDLSGTPRHIKSPVKNSRYGVVQLINDDRIFIENSYETSGSYSYHSLIDADTGEEVYSLKTDMYTGIDISYDKERLALCDNTSQQVLVYGIKNTGLELVRTINIPYSISDYMYCIFDPQNSDRLIIKSNITGKFFIANISSEKTELMEDDFITIDPFTGRMYCFDKNYDSNTLVNVYEKGKYDVPVFQFRAFKYGPFSVYNDFVMSYSSYIQISKYIK